MISINVITNTDMDSLMHNSKRRHAPNCWVNYNHSCQYIVSYVTIQYAWKTIYMLRMYQLGYASINMWLDTILTLSINGFQTYT